LRWVYDGRRSKKTPLLLFSRDLQKPGNPRLRELLRGVYNNEETRLNVAGAAKEPLLKWLEDLIKEACECIVEAMPHKTKGEQEGQLARKTIKKSDITKGKRIFREHYKEQKKKGRK